MCFICWIIAGLQEIEGVYLFASIYVWQSVSVFFVSLLESEFGRKKEELAKHENMIDNFYHGSGPDLGNLGTSSIHMSTMAQCTCTSSVFVVVRDHRTGEGVGD